MREGNQTWADKLLNSIEVENGKKISVTTIQKVKPSVPEDGDWRVVQNHLKR